MKKTLYSLILFVISIQLAIAASSFGGRISSPSVSIGRSISISKPSTSFSNSSTKPSNYSTSKTETPTIKISRNDTLSSLGKKGATGDQAGILYKDFQNKKSQPLPPINNGNAKTIFSQDYRNNRRNDFYSGYTPTVPTHYREVVYVNHPNGYGIWDILLFQSILDNIGDRKMYYNHQDDPSFKQWRSDADAACRAGDTEICDKLADLDDEMSRYHKSGMKVDKNYTTPGVDPDIYETSKIDPKTIPPIKLCTGSLGSDYQQFASKLSSIVKVEIKPINSNGSLDNLTKMSTGECDLGFVQNDLIPESGINRVVELNQNEQAFLICNRNIANPTIYIGSDQTGSQFTYNKISKDIMKDSKLDITHSALEIVPILNNQENSCLFTITTSNSPIIKQLDTNKFYFQPIKVKDYNSSSIPTSVSKNLTKPEYNVWWKFWQTKGTPTINIPVSLVAPDNWAEQNKQTYDLLMLERMNLQAVIK